jgi:hypothetical protein
MSWVYEKTWAQSHCGHACNLGIVTVTITKNKAASQHQHKIVIVIIVTISENWC